MGMRIENIEERVGDDKLRTCSKKLLKILKQHVTLFIVGFINMDDEEKDHKQQVLSSYLLLVILEQPIYILMFVCICYLSQNSGYWEYLSSMFKLINLYNHINSLSIMPPPNLYFSLILYSIISHLHVSALDPVFLTTLSNYQAASKVLLTNNPITTDGFDYETTTFSFSNIYLQAPQVGISLDYLSSSYRTTTTLDIYVLDLILVSKTTTQATVGLNRTSATITLLNINYITTAADSFFDIAHTKLDFSLTNLYLSSLENTQTFQIPYRTKSNSTHAVVVYSTTGLYMERNSNTFNFQITTSLTETTSFTVSIKVGLNNKMKWIRICSINYEKVATDISAPYYLDMGVLTSRSGTLSDTSGVVVTETGTIWTGMTDWQLSDANSILDYNFSLSAKAYTLESSAVTRSRTAYLWYRMQACPNYYYLNVHACDPCDVTCLTCANPTSNGCLTCGTTRLYSNVDHTCTCLDGYAEVGAKQCVEVTCSDTCQTCANLNQCGSCNANFKRYLSGTQCVCMDYRFDSYLIDSQVYCFPCHYSCVHCSQVGVATACTTCSQDRDHRQLLEVNNTCQCMDGYYSNNVAVCLDCQYSCATCVNGVVCATCNITLGRVLNPDTNLCICEDGVFDNHLIETCQSCPVGCLTCSSLIVCLTCPTSRQLILDMCECKSGYFQDPNNIQEECQQCHHSCSTCDQALLCLSCNNTLKRSFSAGQCLCPDYYYDDGVNEQCYSCHFACVTCTDSLITSCLSCDQSMYRELALDGSCVCMAGYYQLNSYTVMCEICDYTCETCNGAGNTNCLTCNSSKYRMSDGSGGCVCQDGYFDNGNQLCQQCYYRCLTCSSLALCDTCDSATRNDSNLALCLCLDGFYDDGISQSCEPCQDQCLTCNNGNNCTSCTDNKILTATKDCECASGTYEPFCLDCSYECEECITTADNCIKCNSTAKRYLSVDSVTGEGNCLCYNGYFSDLTSQECQKCQYSCKTCTSYASCDLCPSNRILNGSYCSCLSEFYENPTNLNCLACHYSCQECSAFSVCTQCNIDNHRILPTGSQTTLCICDDGFYDNTIGELCFTCDTSCLKCTSYPACTDCDSTKFRYLSGTQCLCLDGYFEDPATYLCELCHFSCETCDDATTCLTCSSARYLDSSTKLCECNQGTFNNPLTNTCEVCSYPCLQCSSTALTCTDCSSTFLYEPTISDCSCPTQTFEEPLLEQCTDCLLTCETCDDAISCLTCQTSSQNRQLFNSSCICMPGYHDQDNSILICELCHYSCETCSNSLSCDDCKSNRIITGTSLYCSCPTQLYYDDGSNPICLRCNDKCLSCKGTSNNCTACSTGNHRYLLVTIVTGATTTSYYGDCLCEEGYFDNNGAAMCVSCHYSCDSCASSSTCDSCNQAFGRIYVSGPYCECKPGLFDQTNLPICQTCHVSCLTCTSTSSHCLTCPATRQLNADLATCPCLAGYYAVSPPEATCLSCPYSCSVCISALDCTQCPSTRILTTSADCECINHYYDVQDILECQQCSPLCLECTEDMDKCTDCDAVTGRVLLQNRCICQDGYYSQYEDNGDINCVVCDHSCQRCTSGSVCTSCSQIAERIYNVVSKLCDCMDGFFDDGLNQDCSPCPFDCLTCSDAQTCLTCPSERTSNLATPMRCQCISSYYQNGTDCQLCPPQCTACSSLSVCETCPSPRTLSATFQCLCPVKTYPEVNSPNCLSCLYKCATCKSSTSCTSCTTSLHRYLSGTTCKCLQGFYDDLNNQECATCHYSCLTCSAGAECLTCDATKSRVFDTQSKLCICQPGYYEDNKVCVKCHYSCKTCNGGTSDFCTNCQSVYLRTLTVLSGGQSQCLCPQIGYFDDGTSLCAPCDPTCKTCSSLSIHCDSCDEDTNFRELIVNSCQCLTGYYEYNSQAICSKCAHQCVSCDIAADNCTQCDPAKNRLATIPDCACELGFYDDGTNLECLSCDYRCETCSDGLSCDTCDSSINHRQLSPFTNLCICQIKYFDQNNNDPECIGCHYTCLTCNHPSVCMTCPTTRYFNSGVCLCNTKFYDDSSSTQCQSCHYSCKNCTQLSECEACPSTSHRVFNASTLLCSCARGYYDTGFDQQLCLACDASCYTCTNSTHCQSCYPNSNTTINTTISNYCTCQYSMYRYSPRPPLTLTHLQPFYCKSCHYSCEKCYIEYYYCTECDVAAHRTLTTNSQCLCEEGYFDDGTNELCLACHDTVNCVKCFGQAVGQCMECKPSVFMLNGQCFPVCPEYYYEDDSTWKCKLCIGYCTQCDNSTYCNQCQSGFYLYEINDDLTDGVNECVDICPDFYYQNTTNCLACMSPCLRCTDKYVCLDCIQKYYLNTQCYPCHESCQFCRGGSQLDCISCTQDYFLNSSTGTCMKAICSSTQYVHGVYGCYNCEDTYANSISCTNKQVTQCKSGYKVKDNACISCKYIEGFTLINNTCEEICGDGLKISYPCDDGNILDGDGCSGSCNIEKNWECQSDSTCRLLITPSMTVESVFKVRGQNSVKIILVLNVGIRLYKKNFIVSFVSGNQDFDYEVTALTKVYNQYQLQISYLKTISNDNLKVKVKSPISTSRLLQQTQTQISLNIQLELDVEVPIQTTPPAIYYPQETRSSFSHIIFYIFMALHILALIFIAILIILRLKLLLLAIDLYNFFMMLYLYTVFGLFDIFELVNESCQSLQPFVYLFGTPMNFSENTKQSSVQYYTYTETMVSLIIIQLTIIAGLTIVKTALSSDQKSSLYATFRYFYLSFLLMFAYEIIFACVYTLKWINFSKSVESSYSWGICFVLLVLYTMETGKYLMYGSKYWKYQQTLVAEKSSLSSSSHHHSQLCSVHEKISKNKSILDQKDEQDQDDEQANHLADPFDPFADQQNRTQANIFDQERFSEHPSENRTTAQINQQQKETATDKSSVTEEEDFQVINLFDIHPKKYVRSISINTQQFYYIKVMHPLYLPVYCFLVPLLVSTFAFIEDIITKCILLFILQLASIILFLVLQKKTGKVFLLRTVKIVGFHSILLLISLLGLISAAFQSNSVQNSNTENFDTLSLQLAVISAIGVGIIFSLLTFIFSVIKSDELRAYQLQRKSEAILEQNLRRNRMRNLRGGQNLIDNQDQSSAVVNIFARNTTDEYYQQTDTKINLRIDSIQNNEGRKNSIGLQIIDIEDMNEEELSPAKQKLKKVVNNSELGSSKKISMHNLTEMHKPLKKNFYSVVEEETIQNNSSQSKNRAGRILKNRNKSSFGEYQEKDLQKKYSVKKQMMEEQMQNNNSINLQSTRVQEQKVRDRLKANNSSVRRDVKNSINFNSNHFLSRLQKELGSDRQNDRTIIIKKQTGPNDSRDNTLISDNTSSIEEKRNTKKYQRQLIPTHQHQEENLEDNAQNMKEEEREQRKGSIIVNEEFEEESESESDGSEESVEEKRQKLNADEQDGIDDRIQVQIEDEQKVERVESERKQKKEKNKKYYEYNKKSKSKPKKKLKRKQIPELTSAGKQEEIIPKYLKQSIQKEESQSSEEEQSIEEVEYRYEKAPKQLKRKNVKQDLPEGIKQKPKNQDQRKQAALLHSIVKEQMTGILSNVNKGKSVQKRGPQYRLKRIDSISSIGEQEQEREFYESEIDKQEQQMSQEGNTVFKKILQDYQKYKNKKVRGNLLKKRKI